MGLSAWLSSVYLPCTGQVLQCLLKPGFSKDPRDSVNPASLTGPSMWDIFILSCALLRFCLFSFDNLLGSSCHSADFGDA